MKNKFSIAMSLAVIVAMLVTSLALADAATNQSISINDGASNTNSLLVTIKAAALHCPPGGDMKALEVAFSNTSSSGPWTVVHAAGTDWPGTDTDGCTTSGSGIPANFAWTLASGSDGSRTVYASFKHGNDEVFADDSINFVSPPPSDTTPPVISYVLNPASPDGANGWYKSDVTLTWTVDEPESPDSLDLTGCEDQNITEDQQETTYSCSATGDGGSADQVDVSIKRDATAPIITDDGPTATVNGSNGWYVSAVVNQFSADGAVSRLADLLKANFTVSTGTTEGSAVKVNSGPVSDNAGNTNLGIDSAAFKIDLSDPTVTCASPAPTFLLNQAGAQVTASVADVVSGPASSVASASADTASVGSKMVNITGYDNAGRSTMTSCSYSVTYSFAGFSSPVDNAGVMNVAKAGQAIPLKWRLTDAAGNPVLNLASVKVTVASLACASGTTSDLLEEYAAGSSGLQNLGDGYYQFNWKTPTSYASSCKTMNLDLGDGVPHTALFQFKK